jgi:hypothetical protein
MNQCDIDRYLSKRPSGAQHDCWEWQAAKDAYGYGVFWLAGKNVKAHRVAYELVNGKIGDGMLGCHRCDNRGCCNPAHIFVGSNRDNLADRQAKWRQPHGEKHYNARLSDDDIRTILSSPEKSVILAERYGVHRCYIASLRAGKKRKDITAMAA